MSARFLFRAEGVASSAIEGLRADIADVAPAEVATADLSLYYHDHVDGWISWFAVAAILAIAMLEQ